MVQIDQLKIIRFDGTVRTPEKTLKKLLEICKYKCTINAIL